MLITPTNKELLDRANEVLLRLARQDAKDKGKPDPVKTSEHHGVVVHALGGETGPGYAVVADKLVISNSVKNLERLIDRAVPGPGERSCWRRQERDGRSRHWPSGRNGRHSGPGKTLTRSRGASPTSIGCVNSTQNGSDRRKSRITE